MEEIKIFSEILKTNGLSGFLVLYLFWKFHMHPAWKKRNGTFVSYKEIENTKASVVKMEATIREIDLKLVRVDSKLLEKETKMETLEVAHKRMDRDMEEVKYMVRDIGGSLKTNNRIMGEVKDYLGKLQAKTEE